MMSENNSLALGLVMGLPSLWFLRQQIQSKIVKFGFLVMGTLTCGAIIMCHSRAGILTLGLVIALLVMNSRSKFLVAILAAVMLIPGILLVQDTLTSRMSTLRDPTADLSAFSRILYAQAALRMWQDYPLFGVGWGMLNQQALMPRYSVLPLKQVVHNSYLQMLADAGIFAFLAYISLLFGVIYRLYKEGKRLLPLNPALASYAGAIRIGLIAFSVNSLTQSRIHFDLFYIFVLAAAALESISAGAAGPQPVPVPSTLVSPRIEDPLPRRKMGVPQPVGSSRARTVLAKDRLPR
jgi:O-antigen ligase